MKYHTLIFDALYKNCVPFQLAALCRVNQNRRYFIPTVFNDQPIQMSSNMRWRYKDKTNAHIGTLVTDTDIVKNFFQLWVRLLPKKV